MKIRTDQIGEFERADAPHVPQRLALYAKEAFPKHCRYLDDHGVREAVSYAIQQAGIYGFTQAAGAKLYLELMFLLGRGFDTDPQLPWAAALLGRHQEQAELERCQRLYDQAMEYLYQVSGPRNEFIDEAQRRIGQERLEGASAAEDFEGSVLERMQRIFPEKYTYVGEGPLRQLIQRSVALARQHDLKHPRAVVLFAGLMFLLGASFDSDPQFASITEPLRDRTGEGVVERVDRLYQAAHKYLKEWCG